MQRMLSKNNILNVFRSRLHIGAGCDKDILAYVVSQCQISSCRWSNDAEPSSDVIIQLCCYHSKSETLKQQFNFKTLRGICNVNVSTNGENSRKKTRCTDRHQDDHQPPKEDNTSTYVTHHCDGFLTPPSSTTSQSATHGQHGSLGARNGMQQ
jgi:hypothetical protein